MIWKNISNFPEYQVSDTGEVRSTKYWGQFRRNNSDGILKQRTYKSGYKYVNLYRGGHMYSVKIHRLVAQEFLPNPNSYPMVNHKDENKANNSVDNLEWCNAAYNLNYRDLQKRNHIKQKRRIGAFIDSIKELEFDSATEAAYYVVHLGKAKTFRSAICNISTSANNQDKARYGFIWKWLEESKRK